MEVSIWISLIAILISIIALIQSFNSHKAAVILNIENRLAEKAIICNKFIISETQGHTAINAELSAIFTSIIYAKKVLEMFYKNHWLLLITCDQKDFVRFFYLQLHTSIVELVKNPVYISDYDVHTSPIVEKQHLQCRKFLQSIIDENPSQTNAIYQET